jgi:nucleoside-diphosphate-sugar epimerase
MEKYIITGGLGFIGSTLSEFLVEKEKEVLIIDNEYSGVITNISEEFVSKITIVKDDIRNPEIEKYFNKNDIVIHLAAISSLPECQNNPDLAYDINVRGTINILEICRIKGINKCIFASTSAVYENNTEDAFCETLAVNPTLIYSMTKKNCEDLCLSYVKNYNMDIRIIRFFNVYGGNQDYRRKSPPLTIYIINQLIHNLQPILHSTGKQKRDYIYIDDLLHLIYKIIETDNLKGCIMNACSNTLISVEEIFNTIAQELKSDIKPVYVESKKLWNGYNNLFNGHYKINENVIENEVNKITLGDNTFAKNKLNWDLKHTFKMGIKQLLHSFCNSSNRL